MAKTNRDRYAAKFSRMKVGNSFIVKDVISAATAVHYANITGKFRAISRKEGENKYRVSRVK